MVLFSFFWHWTSTILFYISHGCFWVHGKCILYVYIDFPAYLMLQNLPNNGEVLHSQYVWIWTSTSGSSEWESDQLDSAWLSSKGWNHIPIIYKAAILNIYTPIPWNWICSLHMHIYIHFIEYYPLFFFAGFRRCLGNTSKIHQCQLNTKPLCVPGWINSLYYGMVIGHPTFKKESL